MTVLTINHNLSPINKFKKLMNLEQVEIQIHSHECKLEE